MLLGKHFVWCGRVDLFALSIVYFLLLFDFLAMHLFKVLKTKKGRHTVTFLIHSYSTDNRNPNAY